ncbi:39S ribosomal protein L14 [Trichuris trichiura]|uniref:Large ribosomal subunit protein uL14m n=1 Tax=Trichuris trichiura TaxID=36087 RepID=A0A077ZBJ4_TRITR|nr:39S ribosomal protein L14 [Trichuris trichiura]
MYMRLLKHLYHSRREAFITSAPLLWIHLKTRFRAVDNSAISKQAMLAGRPPYCINVYRDGRMGSKARRGRLGDKILVALKGEMRRAFIVGWKMHHKQIVHGIPRSDSNNIVVLNPDGNPAGTKVMVPIPACLAASKDPTLQKIVAMADTLV